MKRQSNLKVAEPEAMQLTYDQTKELADEISAFVWDHPRLGDLLLILMNEVGRFYRDGSHVEGMAIQVRDAVFAKTVESDRAEDRYVRAVRAQFLREGASQ